ncbi:MAG: hypothetical protein JWP53_1637 [Conexibacter sp.]|nr:hypothetical protein [Conexibacter sp.]
MRVLFMTLPIQLACPVPVRADGAFLDDQGEPLPMDERPERCAVWAHWMIGAQVSCDIHTAHACAVLDIDFDDLVRETGRNVADARQPWSERKRATQEDAEMTARTVSDALADGAER